MARSQMRERFRYFDYSSPTVSGVVTDTYTMVPSGEPDGAYFAARGVPGAREVAIAGARDFRADGVVSTPDDSPWKENGLLRDLEDERLYFIRGPIQHARQHGTLVVIIESSSFATGKTVRIVGEP